ncbi:N-acetylmuramoyl-L-alanine amidase [Lysinibacillus pakistanensis]|uniref:N-acetylmuramoyl-L-alanine amidase n=1 Tax=Lysinibacillus pakistanensis TaxID=759811 RepID=UPI003D26C8EF
MKYTIGTDYLSKGTNRRSGIKANKIRFIVLHDVGNDGYSQTTGRRNGTTARNNINYYKNSQNVSASAHTFIDDIEILECIPATTGTPEKAWHVLYDKTIDNQLYGADANDAAIGVELCYFPEDKTRSQKAYDKYVWYCAYLAYYFNLDPSKCFSGHEKLDPGRKTDPSNGLKWINKTTAKCIQDIIAEYNECAGKNGSTSQPSPQPSVPSSKEIGAITVNVASLNVRKGAAFDAPVVKTISKGQSYKVYEKKNGLYKIGENEWCSAGDAYVTFKAIVSTFSHIGIIEILVGSLNVRNAPSFNAPILKTVSKGTKWKAYKKENGMYNLGGNQWCSAGEKFVRFIKA